MCELSDDQTSLADADSATDPAATLASNSDETDARFRFAASSIRNIFDGDCYDKILFNQPFHFPPPTTAPRAAWRIDRCHSNLPAIHTPRTGFTCFSSVKQSNDLHKSPET